MSDSKSIRASRLQQPPRVERLAVSRPQTALGKIEPIGGRYGAGLIPGVSLCTRGEALGHFTWIDAFMIGQIVEAANANQKLLRLAKRWERSRTPPSAATRPLVTCTCTSQPTKRPTVTWPVT
jgi:hypothetical protein